MKIVIDSNILFSSLLSKNNKFKDFIHSDKYRIYTCNFLFIEIFKHKNKLVKLSKMSEMDLLNELSNLTGKITFINENVIPKEIMKYAYDICRDINEKDTPFFALSLFIDAVLLTGDKNLVKKLRSKGFINTKSINEMDEFK